MTLPRALPLLPAALLAATALAGPAAAVSPSEPADAFWARMHDTDGNRVGTVTLEATTTGTVLLNASFEGLPEGSHGFHIHETGACSPDFEAAGGHFAPRGHSHGILEGEGRHAGDLPNVTVPASGNTHVQFFVEGVSLVKGEEGYLLDADGSAFIVHAGPDDYESQPAGDAGGRIACGVIERLDDDQGRMAERS